MDQHFICLVILPSFERFELNSDDDYCERKDIQFKFWYFMNKMEESVIADPVCISMQYHTSPSNIKSYGMCSMSE